MNASNNAIQGSDPSQEQLRLQALFDELRKNQLTYLDKAGKRVIELSTGLLGLLFTVIAFGKEFPPPYLLELTPKVLAIGTLIFLFLALTAGLLCVQPKQYKDYANNLTMMKSVLRRLSLWKVWCFRIGSIFYVLGALWLVCLIIFIIL